MFSKLSKAIKTLCCRSREPLHIEFNLTDFCNLNCKGCSHFSPLAPREFESIVELENSMRHIAGIKNVGLIEEIYLIGGETLLYPDLKEAITMARKYFPYTKISIFTNGLLLSKMDEEFWNICRSQKCIIAITRYPVKADYDALEKLCSEKSVEVQIFGDRSLENSFFKFPLDPEKKQNRAISHFRCYSFGCITIDQGRIYPCPQAACIRHLNNRFGTDFKLEKGDFIEVTELKDAKQLKTLRNSPIPFCSYCCHTKTTSYGPSRRIAEEWLA